MEWVFGSVIAVVFGLFVWSVATTRREVTKRVQPVIDDLFWPEDRDTTGATRHKTECEDGDPAN